MRLGVTRPGATAEAAADGALRLLGATLPGSQRLVRVAAYLDGLGGGVGAQNVRAVIYTAAGALVASSVERSIADSSPAAWQTFRFDPAGMELPAGGYRVGLHFGPVGGILRTYRTGAGANRYTATDAYPDGAPAVLPALTTTAGPFAVMLETMDPVAIPVVEDLHYARLPFPLAQRVLGATGPVPRSGVQALAGWHSVTTDPEEGAFAIVRTGGPLEELVGRRIRVTRRVGTAERVVYAYVHEADEWPEEIDDEDFSLALRAFLELGELSAGAVAVTVERLVGLDG